MIARIQLHRTESSLDRDSIIDVNLMSSLASLVLRPSGVARI